MKTLAIGAIKASHFALKLIGRGGSLPGTIGLKIDGNLLSKFKIDCPVILVTGTNGKTSTTNIIADMLRRDGKRVVSNLRGDNLLAGITTTIATNASLGGRVGCDAIVLEVDELNVQRVLPNLPTNCLVVNNFFRDQLDRAKEMEQLIQTIEAVLVDYKGSLILNGNDPNVLRLSKVATKAQSYFFEMGENALSKVETSEAAEGKFCPVCGNRLSYDYYQYSHIGKFYCPNCQFKTPEDAMTITEINLDKGTFIAYGREFRSPEKSLYTMYNLAAVLMVAKALGISRDKAQEAFDGVELPKGRNEAFYNGNKRCILNLVKNPTGTNEVLKVVEQDKEPKSVCIVLNDKDQDGTDVSWIYDAHFERLMNDATKDIVCTGLRGYDMALRIYYGGYKGNIAVEEDMAKGIAKTIAMSDNSYIISTYTSLLESRQTIVKEMKE